MPHEEVRQSTSTAAKSKMRCAAATASQAANPVAQRERRVRKARVRAPLQIHAERQESGAGREGGGGQSRRQANPVILGHAGRRPTARTQLLSVRALSVCVCVPTCVCTPLLAASITQTTLPPSGGRRCGGQAGEAGRMQEGSRPNAVLQHKHTHTAPRIPLNTLAAVYYSFGCCYACFHVQSFSRAPQRAQTRGSEDRKDLPSRLRRGACGWVCARAVSSQRKSTAVAIFHRGGEKHFTLPSPQRRRRPPRSSEAALRSDGVRPPRLPR